MRMSAFVYSILAGTGRCVVKRIAILTSMLLVFGSVAWSQEKAKPDDNRAAIHGHGTPNHIAKFKGEQSIADTAILESSGCMSESESFARDVAGILCLHDSLGIGGAMEALANFPNQSALLVVNDSPVGDPVGVQGQTASADRGIGVRGQATNSSGTGIGVLGEEVSPNGTAGVFNAIGGGNILVGIGFNAFTSFRVDANGNTYANSYNIGGADFAESIAVLGDQHQYEPGDLLVIDPTGNRRLDIARREYSTLVAGIYSTKPGVLASAHTMDDPNLLKEVPLAIIGIVPCKVTAENGPIEVGDLLVTSSTAGRAMKGTDRMRMLGAVAGKALQPLREGTGVIQVLVALQ